MNAHTLIAALLSAALCGQAHDFSFVDFQARSADLAQVPALSAGHVNGTLTVPWSLTEGAALDYIWAFYDQSGPYYHPHETSYCYVHKRASTYPLLAPEQESPGQPLDYPVSLPYGFEVGASSFPMLPVHPTLTLKWQLGARTE